MNTTERTEALLRELQRLTSNAEIIYSRANELNSDNESRTASLIAKVRINDNRAIELILETEKAVNKLYIVASDTERITRKLADHIKGAYKA